MIKILKFLLNLADLWGSGGGGVFCSDIFRGFLISHCTCCGDGAGALDQFLVSLSLPKHVTINLESHQKGKRKQIYTNYKYKHRRH